MRVKKARIIIAHGWASTPNRGWILWLAQQLNQRGEDVVAPQLQNPKKPDLSTWIDDLAQVADGADRLILVGHSLGSFALLHLILVLPKSVKIDKLILVAPFYTADGTSYWPQYKLKKTDFGQIKKRTKRIYCIYSTNDRVVDTTLSRRLAIELRASIIPVVKSGHFSNLRLDTLQPVLDCVDE